MSTGWLLSNLFLSTSAVESPSGPSERPKRWVLRCYAIGLDCAKLFVKSLYSNRVQIVKTGVVDLKGKETVVPKKHGRSRQSVLLFCLCVVFSFVPPSRWSGFTVYGHDRRRGREMDNVWLWIGRHLIQWPVIYIEILVIFVLSVVSVQIGWVWIGCDKICWYIMIFIFPCN